MLDRLRQFLNFAPALAGSTDKLAERCAKALDTLREEHDAALADVQARREGLAAKRAAAEAECAGLASLTVIGEARAVARHKELTEAILALSAEISTLDAAAAAIPDHTAKQAARINEELRRARIAGLQKLIRERERLARQIEIAAIAIMEAFDRSMELGVEIDAAHRELVPKRSSMNFGGGEADPLAKWQTVRRLGRLLRRNGLNEVLAWEHHDLLNSAIPVGSFADLEAATLRMYDPDAADPLTYDQVMFAMRRRLAAE